MNSMTETFFYPFGLGIGSVIVTIVIIQYLRKKRNETIRD